MTPLHSFRVCVPRRYGVKAAVVVIVHPTLKSLRQAHAPITGKDARDVMAFCHLWPRVVPAATKRISLLADIHLSEKHIHLDTIIHEVTHAAISWIGKDKQRWVTLIDESDVGVEEQFCELVAGLTSETVKALERRGVEVRK